MASASGFRGQYSAAPGQALQSWFEVVNRLPDVLGGYAGGLDFVPGEDVCGSDTVWDAVAEFKDRWERGVNDLVGDVEEVSGRLGKVAMTYAEFDAAGVESFAGATQAVGEVVAAAVPGGGG